MNIVIISFVYPFHIFYIVSFAVIESFKNNKLPSSLKVTIDDSFELFLQVKCCIMKAQSKAGGRKQWLNSITNHKQRTPLAETVELFALPQIRGPTYILTSMFTTTSLLQSR